MTDTIPAKTWRVWPYHQRCPDVVGEVIHISCEEWKAQILGQSWIESVDAIRLETQRMRDAGEFDEEED